jgi:ribosomal protein S3AE
LFSDSARNARFLGLSIDRANSKWALENTTKAKFSLFSLRGQLVVPFSDGKKLENSINRRMLRRNRSRVTRPWF